MPNRIRIPGIRTDRFQMAKTQKNKATSYHLGMRKSLNLQCEADGRYRTVEGEALETKARTLDPD